LSNFSIKDIEALTGIKCHTLRVWEQRYGIIKPKRTDTNIRYFDDEDLKFLLNVSVLNCHNYKISEIAKMSREDMNEAVLRLSSQHNEFSGHIKSLLCAMLHFDEYDFHQKLTTNIIQHGLEQTMIRIVFPLLNEIGILWQVGSIQSAHEHFVTNIIKQKLYVAIDGQIGRHIEGRKKFLLFLPETEQHGLGLLFANYIIRSRGHEVIYLGQEVPLQDMKQAFVTKECPDYIFTTFTSTHLQDKLQEVVNFLTESWPNTQILLSGFQILVADIIIPKNVHVLKRMDEFIEIANNLTAVAKEV